MPVRRWRRDARPKRHRSDSEPLRLVTAMQSYLFGRGVGPGLGSGRPTAGDGVRPPHAPSRARRRRSDRRRSRRARHATPRVRATTCARRGGRRLEVGARRRPARAPEQPRRARRRSARPRRSSSSCARADERRPRALRTRARCGRGGGGGPPRATRGRGPHPAPGLPRAARRARVLRPAWRGPPMLSRRGSRAEEARGTLDRGRMLALFRPYRARLGAVLFLILVSAALGMVSPFLLRGILDRAIPARDTTLLSALVGGMIAIAVANGALGVAQTLLSNTVGQRVMHDLRAAVYRHLQRLSFSFFTRTRTGEIQSRIANDIGGVQSVVTRTATSIVSNVTTVIAAATAMFLLDWRLAVFALGLLPFFVWLTRRVGEERRRITGVRQGRLADISALVEESLSVSGMLLGRTMGRQSSLAERFERESTELADLEVRSRMAGRWRMASVQIAFAAMPALVYLFGGLSMAGGGAAISIGTLVAFTTLQTRLFFPVQSLLSVGVDVQSSLALFERVFEYLDLPIEVEEGEGALALPASEVRGDVAFEDVSFAYEAGEPILRDVALR